MLPVNFCKECGMPIPEKDYICYKCAEKNEPPYYKCKYFNNFCCDLTGDDCLSKCELKEEISNEM